MNIVLGRDSGTWPATQADADYHINGTFTNEKIATEIEAADFDGDGKKDLFFSTNSGTNIYLLLGSDLANMTAGDYTATDSPIRNWTGAQYSGGSIGDVDGDGADDFWLYTTLATHPTRNSVISSDALLAAANGTNVADVAYIARTGDFANTKGRNMFSVGDIDSNGLGDFCVVGNPQAGFTGHCFLSK